MLYKIVILILVILALLTKNKNLAAASAVIFAVSITNSQKTIDFIEKYFMDLGMIFLMMWMLIPLIKSTGISSFKSLLTINGAVAFIMGVLVVVLAAKGVSFTKGNADVLSGVVLGSIVGVSFLGGVPVGPLIASGIAYEVIKLISLILGHK